MSAGSGVVTGAAKLWVYPTMVLAVIAPPLAVAWSNTFTEGAGTGTGIVVEDAPELVEHFRNGQRIAGAEDAPTGPAPVVPSPTDAPVVADAAPGS